MESNQISVIIPVYNVETKLSACLDSVLCQDYLHEIILINDGSQDSSDIICQKYQQQYPQIIKYKAIDNHGVSYARNIGIDMATGKYINFVDSDDTLAVKAYKSIIEDMNESDIIFWGLTKVFQDGGTITYTPSGAKCDNKAEIESSILNLKLNDQHFAFFGFSVNKLYKRSIIEKYNIRFHSNLNIAEDELFCIEYCSHIQSLNVIPASYYHYNIQPLSLTTKKKNISEYIFLSMALLNNAKSIQTEELFNFEIIRAYAFAYRGYIENSIYEFLKNRELRRILLKTPVVKAKSNLYQYKSRYVSRILETENTFLRVIYLVISHFLLK